MSNQTLEKVSVYHPVLMQLDPGDIRLITMVGGKIKDSMLELIQGCCKRLSNERSHIFDESKVGPHRSIDADLEQLCRLRTEQWRAMLECRFDDAYWDKTNAVAEYQCGIGLRREVILAIHLLIVQAIAARAERFLYVPLRPRASITRIAHLQASLISIALATAQVELAIFEKIHHIARNDDLRAMTSRIERSVDESAAAIDSLTEGIVLSASQLSSMAMSTSSYATQTSASAAQTLQNAQATAEETQRVRQSIAEISRQAENARMVVDRTAAASRSAQSVMAGLSDATALIGTVADMISEIAGKTNLLALNATIESARAGEAGKGFAVVAGEVKSLANQTANATMDIARQIETIRGVAAQAVSAISDVASTIGELEASTDTIVHAVEAQNAAVAAIAETVEQTITSSDAIVTLMQRLAAEASTAKYLAETSQKDSTGVNQSMGNLRKTLTQQVGRSIEESGFRRYPTHNVFFQGTLIVGIERHAMTVSRIAMGETTVQLERAGQSWPEGTVCVIDVEEFGSKCAGTIAGMQDGNTVIAFAPNTMMRLGRFETIAKRGALALIEKAKSDHAQFVKNIETALVKKNGARASALTDHHSCRFGRWYDMVTDETIHACPSYQKLPEPHAAVHSYGKKALSLHEQGADGVEDAVVEMKKASTQVVSLLASLQDEIIHTVR